MIDIFVIVPVLSVFIVQLCVLLVYHKVIQREAWEHIRDDDIQKAAASFLGEIWQVPPMFSAIKVSKFITVKSFQS